MKYFLNEFVLDEGRGSLTGPCGEVRLRPKAFELLLLLACEAPRMLTNSQIQHRIWKSEHVSPYSVSRLVSDLRRALGDDPQQPRFIKNLHGRGYRLICDVRVSEDLGQQQPDSTPSAAAPAERQLLGVRAKAAMLLGLLAVASILIGHNPRLTSQRPAISVVGFEDLAPSEQTHWLSSGLADTLRLQLAEGEGVHVLSPDTDLRVGRSLGAALGKQAKVVPSSLEQHDAADWLVSGSYRMETVGDARQLKIRCWILDLASGEQEQIVAIADGDDILPLVVELASAVYDRLGLSARALRPTALLREMPPNRDALRELVLGREALRSFDPLAASEHLRRAVEGAPEWPLAHWSLARALDALGYQEEALREVEMALEQAPDLRHEERLLIEGLRHKLAGEMARAVDSYQALFAFFPDNLDYGLLLVETLYKSTRLEQAQETVERLRGLPGPLGGDIRIDFSETFIANGLGAYERMLEVAQNAMKKAEASDSRHLLAFAEYRLGEAWARNREASEAMSLLQRSAERFAAGGDLWNAARARLRRAGLLMRQGSAAAAIDDLEWAAAVSRRIGNRKGVADSLLLAGRAALVELDVDAARSMARQAREVYRSIGNLWGVEAALIDEGNVEYAAGPLEQAMLTVAAALESARERDQRHGHLAALEMIGLIFMESGRLTEARTQIEEAVSLGQAWGSNLDLGPTLNLASLELEVGNLDAAQALLEPLRKRCREAEFVDGEKSALLSLARLAIARGDLRLAQGHLESADSIPSFVAGRADHFLNLAALADLDRMRGALASAAVRLEQTEERFPPAVATYGLAGVWAARARYERALGNGRKAREWLDQALVFYRRSGRSFLELEMRLAVAELDLDNGDETVSERAASEVAAAYATAGHGAGVAEAFLLEGRARAALGRTTAAKESLAKSRAAGPDNFPRSVQQDLLAAELVAADGDLATAMAAAVSLQRQAAAGGFALLRLEGGLVEAKLASLAGEPERAFSLALRVESEARALGFGRLARAAASLRVRGSNS